MGQIFPEEKRRPRVTTHESITAMTFLTSLRTLATAGLALAATATGFAKNRGHHDHHHHYSGSRGGVYISSGYRGGYYAPRPYCPPVAYQPSYYAQP